MFIKVSGSRNPKYEAASPLRLNFRTQRLRCRTPSPDQCPSPRGANVGGGNLVTNVACRAEASGARGPPPSGTELCEPSDTGPGPGQPGGQRFLLCDILGRSRRSPLRQWMLDELNTRPGFPLGPPGPHQRVSSAPRPGCIRAPSNLGLLASGLPASVPPGAPRLSAFSAQLPPLRFSHIFPHHSF